VVKSASSNAEQQKINREQIGADLLGDEIALAAPWSAMPVRAVFLVGFMASGKSCVGQELARRLDWDFVDLDALVESRERQTIVEIFRDRGETGFRMAETSALRELTESLKRATVVALGGGTFAQPINRELLQPWHSVFLDVPCDELWQRSLVDADKRPLRKDGSLEFARLYEYRRPFYSQATVTVVTAGRDLASLCAEIERSLQSQGSPESTSSTQNPSISLETGESH
jgi:shikimate kinase